jgi:hypothetical protein
MLVQQHRSFFISLFEFAFTMYLEREKRRKLPSLMYMKFRLVIQWTPHLKLKKVFILCYDLCKLHTQNFKLCNQRKYLYHISAISVRFFTPTNGKERLKKRVRREKERLCVHLFLIYVHRR